MSKNYMRLGSTALADLKREEKRGTDRAKQERKEVLAYEYRVDAVRRKLRNGKPEGTLPEVVISVLAHDKGFAAHVLQGNKRERVVRALPGSTLWANGLDGLITGLEKVQAWSEIVIVHSDPQIAATLCPQSLAQYEKDNWIDSRTGASRRHAEKWKRLKQLLGGHAYVAVSDKEMNSPILKMCGDELKKRLG